MSTLRQKLCVTRRNTLTISNITSNVFAMTLFSKGSSGSQKGVQLSYVTTTLDLRRNKQSTIATVRCSRDDMFALDTYTLF
jgi:hypothetical protein